MSFCAFLYLLLIDPESPALHFYIGTTVTLGQSLILALTCWLRNPTLTTYTHTLAAGNKSHPDTHSA